MFPDSSVSVISVSIVASLKETRGTLSYRLDSKDPGFIVLLDGKEVFKEYGGLVIPTTFVVDRIGRIRFRHVDFHSGMEIKMAQEIRFLLEED